MGLLDMDSSEIELHQDFINEGLKLRGIRSTIFTILSKVKDINTDPTLEYNPSVEVDILFESDPKTKLKRLSWYHEDEEGKPYLMYIPYEDINGNDLLIEKDCIIELSVLTHGIDERKFIVTRVDGQATTLYWTAKIVPYKDQFDVDPDTPGVQEDRGKNSMVDNNYLRRDCS